MKSLQEISGESFKRRIYEVISTDCTSEQLKEIATLIKVSLPSAIWQRIFSDLKDSKKILQSICLLPAICNNVSTSLTDLRRYLKVDATHEEWMSYLNKLQLSTYLDSTVGYILLTPKTIPVLSDLNLEKYTRLYIVDLVKEEENIESYKDQITWMCLTVRSRVTMNSYSPFLRNYLTPLLKSQFLIVNLTPRHVSSNSEAPRPSRRCFAEDFIRSLKK